MTNHAKIQLSRLREIGWKVWDPIGLADDHGVPPEGSADEYDRYLLHVAGMFDHGASTDEATAYLIGVATGHMGLTAIDAGAAAATARGIADYLKSLPDGPKTVR